MGTLVLALGLLINNYCGGGQCTSLDDWAAMTGHAFSEAACVAEPNYKNPSCVAFCQSSQAWLSIDDINAVVADCEDIIGAE